MKRPPSTPQTKVADFRNFYWYLNELALFCRKQGLPIFGQKDKLVERIETYLTTGQCAAKARGLPARSRLEPRALAQGEITLDSPVTKDFKCDDRPRAILNL